MIAFSPIRRAGNRSDRGRGRSRAACLMGMFLVLAGCQGDGPAATVEGTLRLQGTPLDNCLVRFLPEPGTDGPAASSAGVTDQLGRYHLRLDNQRPGAAIGWHRVTVEDLSVSTGVPRRDHGTIDAEHEDTTGARPVRPSRVPDQYTRVERTPWRKVVNAGPQVIDLEIP